MSPLDVISAVAVLVGGACVYDVFRRLRTPSIFLPARDCVVNAEASGLSLCMLLVVLDLLAHWVAAHGGGIMPSSPPGPFATPAGVS
jgi:hypothetical protein